MSSPLSSLKEAHHLGQNVQESWNVILRQELPQVYNLPVRVGDGGFPPGLPPGQEPVPANPPARGEPPVSRHVPIWHSSSIATPLQRIGEDGVIAAARRGRRRPRCRGGEGPIFASWF